MRWMPWIALAAGCGRIAFDARTDDARTADGGDAIASCTTPGAWGTPELITGFVGAFANDVKLSPNKLELFYAIMGADYDLRVSTRASVTDDFVLGPPVVSTGFSETDPTITADGLDLFFVSERLTMMAGMGQMFVAHRNSVDEAFVTAVQVPGLESERLFSAEVSGDGLSLYSAYGIGFGVATRATRSDPFGTPVPVGVSGAYPALSADELELYIDGGSDCVRYTRASKADAWVVDPTFAIPGVGALRDVALSTDGRELWFWSSLNGDVYRSVRSCGST